MGEALPQPDARRTDQGAAELERAATLTRNASERRLLERAARRAREAAG